VLVVDVHLPRADDADADGGGGGGGARDGARLRLCVTHLSPASAQMRRAEAAAMARLQAAEPHVPFLVVGDLNTLSPLDARAHAATRLRDALAARAPLAKEFLNEAGKIAY
jgi:endonuclease/exonuclease/phosphatase family metal-dependent hydrolase